MPRQPPIPVPAESPTPQLNRILASLPADELSRLADDLELITLPAGCVLYEAGDTLPFAYFPTTCVFSLISTAEDGSTAEVAMTGKDGMVGITLVLGGETTNHKVVVQCAGEAYRLRAEVLCWELDQGVGLLGGARGGLDAQAPVAAVAHRQAVRADQRLERVGNVALVVHQQVDGGEDVAVDRLLLVVVALEERVELRL